MQAWRVDQYFRSGEIEGWEGGGDAVGFEADGHDADEEFEGVFGVVHGFGGQKVWFGVDGVSFGGGGCVEFHDPFGGWLVIDAGGVAVGGFVADRELRGSEWRVA